MIRMKCLSCRGVLGSGDVTHFQYDVAEVKLGIKDRPAWIEDLVNSGQSTYQSSQQHPTRTALCFHWNPVCVELVSA
jgi:hypothetical protein